ncbi:MAG: O-antigen ligase family protein [Gammaproteobacteria bacterium]|nr:O-antigen ligase family protein [Gammaproteobacteria bacterium]
MERRLEKRQLVIAVLVGGAYALTIDNAGGATDVVLLLAMMLSVAGAVTGLMPLVTGGPATVSSIQAAVGAYLFWLAVLVYTSTLAENSIQFGWRLGSVALIFLATFGLDRRRWLFTWLLFALAGAVSAVWGIGEFFATGIRSNGPIVDPSTWGATQNLLFFSTVAVFIAVDWRRRWQQYLLIAALAVFSLATFSAYSRVGNLIYFVALAFIVLVCIRFRALRRKLAIVVAVSALSFALVNLYSTPTEATRHTEGYTLDVESFAWQQRLLMWQSAWEIYQEYPVFGTGPGNIQTALPAPPLP